MRGPEEWERATRVPLFYLHSRCSDMLARDPDGSELPDLDAARREALAAARELWAEAIMHGKDLSACTFVIADEQGRQFLIVPFTDALPEGLRKRLRPGEDRLPGGERE